MTKVLQIESKKSQTIHFFFEVISLNLADTNRIYLFKKKKKIQFEENILLLLRVAISISVVNLEGKISVSFFNID